MKKLNQPCAVVARLADELQQQQVAVELGAAALLPRAQHLLAGHADEALTDLRLDLAFEELLVAHEATRLVRGRLEHRWGRSGSSRGTGIVG